MTSRTRSLLIQHNTYHCTPEKADLDTLLVVVIFPARQYIPVFVFIILVILLFFIVFTNRLLHLSRRGLRCRLVCTRPTGHLACLGGSLRFLACFIYRKQGVEREVLPAQRSVHATTRKTHVFE